MALYNLKQRKSKATFSIHVVVHTAPSLSPIPRLDRGRQSHLLGLRSQNRELRMGRKVVARTVVVRTVVVHMVVDRMVVVRTEHTLAVVAR